MESESEVVKKCIKCNHVLYDNLNIVYNASTYMIVLWNKFQIFVYEDRNLENAAKILIPEFQIHQLILSNNYILCLDNSCNVHTISLKFKNPAQKRLKSSFQPREQNIFACFHVQDHALSIKHEVHQIFLCLHKINSEFLLEKKVELKYSNPWPLLTPELGKCVLTSSKINEQDFDHIKQVYKVNTMPKDCSIVFLTLDKLSIFTCLFSPKMSEEEVALIKLHTCPSEISGIEIMDDWTILICLKSGSIIQFYLKDSSKEPDIVHLNIAVDKYIAMKDTFVYTDGISMWKAENFLSNDISFRQFIIKQLKDLVKCGDQIICTSYSNLIYVIPIDEDTSYAELLSTQEYCEAGTLLNNSEYLYRILEEVEQNNDMVKRVREEGNYITVLSLSNRHDVMDSIIQQNITVYDNYEEVLKEHSELLLMDNMNEYFDQDSVLFLMKISTKILQQTFSNILGNLFNDLQIHLSFFSDTKLLKTTTLKLKESLKKINMLTALKVKSAAMSEVNVIIKLISCIPGAHDRKQPLWSCLYEKHISFKSEHFIKTNTLELQNRNMKDPEDSIENLIYKVENNYHRQLFKFVDVSIRNTDSSRWSMYLKLPSNYIELFLANTSKEINKADFLRRQYTDREFLESKRELVLEIGTNKAIVKIIDEFSIPLLQVSSENISIAYNIRNFFSRLIYNDYKSQDGREFVKYTLYNVAENLQKELRQCLAEPQPLETFILLADNFERSIVGSLPM